MQSTSTPCMVVCGCMQILSCLCSTRAHFRVCMRLPEPGSAVTWELLGPAPELAPLVVAGPGPPEGLEAAHRRVSVPHRSRRAHCALNSCWSACWPFRAGWPVCSEWTGLSMRMRGLIGTRGLAFGACLEYHRGSPDWCIRLLSLLCLGLQAQLVEHANVRMHCFNIGLSGTSGGRELAAAACSSGTASSRTLATCFFGANFCMAHIN